MEVTTTFSNSYNVLYGNFDEEVGRSRGASASKVEQKSRPTTKCVIFKAAEGATYVWREAIDEAKEGIVLQGREPHKK